MHSYMPVMSSLKMTTVRLLLEFLLIFVELAQSGISVDGDGRCFVL